MIGAVKFLIGVNFVLGFDKNSRTWKQIQAINIRKTNNKSEFVDRHESWVGTSDKSKKQSTPY